MRGYKILKNTYPYPKWYLNRIRKQKSVSSTLQSHCPILDSGSNLRHFGDLWAWKKCHQPHESSLLTPRTHHSSRFAFSVAAVSSLPKKRRKKKEEEKEGRGGEEEGRGGRKRIPLSEARAACEPSVQREAASANDHCHDGKRLSLHARIEAENNRHPYIQRKKQKCACSCFSKNR